MTVAPPSTVSERRRVSRESARARSPRSLRSEVITVGSTSQCAKIHSGSFTRSRTRLTPYDSGNTKRSVSKRRLGACRGRYFADSIRCSSFAAAARPLGAGPGPRRAPIAARAALIPEETVRSLRRTAARALPTRALTAARRRDRLAFSLDLAFAFGRGLAADFRRPADVFLVAVRALRVDAIRKV